jgi:hypothetical protein
LAWK